MMKRTPPLTAEEFAARLKASPEAVAAAKARYEQTQQNAAEYRGHAAPVVQALRGAGINVDSISAAQGDSRATSVLLEHLRKPYPQKVVGEISNTLATPQARSAWPILVSEYKARPAPNPSEGLGPKNGLANALAATVTKDTIDELIALVKDPSHGSSRLLLLRGIRRSRTPQAKQAIEELASDPQLAREIASWKKRK